MKRYRVNTLDEATALAEQLKQEGEYDLFRGQTKCYWSLKSSMQRAEEANIEKANHLYNYLSQTDGCQKYVPIDVFDAICQHYGLPTYLVDFTTEPKVAAFFASHIIKEDKNLISCHIVNEDDEDFRKLGIIYCINSKDIENTTEQKQIEYPDIPKENFPYIVTPNIDNLWRLQAQKGCFISTGIDGWEQHYPMAMILFLHTQDHEIIPKEEIYPTRKSSLENILDHFFAEYERIQNVKQLQKTINKVRSNGGVFYEFNLTENKKNEIDVHDSWLNKNIDKWITPRNIKWRGTNKVQLSLTFDSEKTFSHNLLLIKHDILMFINKCGMRNHHISFVVKYNSKLNSHECTCLIPNPDTNKSGFVKIEAIYTENKEQIISENCAKIWDGTIALPYKNKQIAYMIAKYICIELSSFRDQKRPNLEFGQQYGSAGKGCCSDYKLQQCYRDDWKKCIESKYHNIPLWYKINYAKCIFDFYKFKRTFICQILPWQVFFATNIDNNTPIYRPVYYSPTNMEEFGMP